jgi:hypothetical protein
VIVTVGPFNELNCCTIVDYLNIWIDPIEALAGIDEKSVRKTSTGCFWVEVEVLPLPVRRCLLKNWHLLQNL